MSFQIANLPDFLSKDSRLNRVRQSMGADLIDPISALRLQVIDLDEVLRTVGEVVDLRDITFAPDGTIVYKDRRVILYIRDKTKYNGELKLPRFHLANCQTLKDMWAKNRSERYVVSTRVDGIFKVNISNDGGDHWDEKEIELDVCKFCLESLDWNGYQASARGRRASIFSDFHLTDFFDRYKGTPVTYSPKHTDFSAPRNQYPTDFPAQSRSLRQSVGYRCQGCSADLSDPRLRRYLHVHHRDGTKYNNHPSNLEVLCIECHLRQENHGHLLASPDVAAYRKVIADLKRSVHGRNSYR